MCSLKFRAATSCAEAAGRRWCRCASVARPVSGFLEVPVDSRGDRHCGKWNQPELRTLALGDGDDHVPRGDWG